MQKMNIGKFWDFNKESEKKLKSLFMSSWQRTYQFSEI